MVSTIVLAHAGHVRTYKPKWNMLELTTGYCPYSEEFGYLEMVLDKWILVLSIKNMCICMCYIRM